MRLISTLQKAVSTLKNPYHFEILANIYAVLITFTLEENEGK